MDKKTDQKVASPVAQLQCVIRTIVRHRKTAGVIFGVICVLFLLYALFGTKYYSSSGTILAQADQSLSGFGAMLGGGAMALTPGNLLRGGASLDFKMLSLLRSRDIFERVIAETRLLQHICHRKWDEEKQAWKDDFKPNLDDIYEKYTGDIFDAYYDEENMVVKFSVTTSDRILSYEVANAVIEQLQVLLNEKSNSKAGKIRVFLEKRISQIEVQLAQSSESLKNFQIENQIYMPDSQITGAVEIMTELEAEKVANEIQMGVMAKYSNPSNPKLKAMQDAVDEINAKIETIKIGGDTQGSEKANLLPPLEKTPELIQQYLAYKRDVMVYEKLYALLMAEFEYEKIKEKKDDFSFVLIDSPNVAENKAKPRRSLVMLAGIFLALLSAVGTAYAKEYYPQVKGFLEESITLADQPEKEGDQV